MDQDRQIRLLVPPFLFFASFALGLWIDSSRWTVVVGTHNKDEWLVAGVVVAASLLPIGFLFNATATLLLRLIFALFRRPYEACLSAQALGDIASVVGVQPHTTNTRFFAVVTFDHAILEPGVHAWITRTWSAFSISVNSVVALLAAHGVAHLFGIPQQKQWLILSAIVLVVLTANAIVTWRNTMAMIEFQLSRHKVRQGTGQAPSTSPRTA